MANLLNDPIESVLNFFDTTIGWSLIIQETFAASSETAHSNTPNLCSGIVKSDSFLVNSFFK